MALKRYLIRYLPTIAVLGWTFVDSGLVVFWYPRFSDTGLSLFPVLLGLSFFPDWKRWGIVAEDIFLPTPSMRGWLVGTAVFVAFVWLLNYGALCLIDRARHHSKEPSGTPR